MQTPDPPRGLPSGLPQKTCSFFFLWGGVVVVLENDHDLAEYRPYHGSSLYALSGNMSGYIRALLKNSGILAGLTFFQVEKVQGSCLLSFSLSHPQETTSPWLPLGLPHCWATYIVACSFLHPTCAGITFSLQAQEDENTGDWEFLDYFCFSLWQICLCKPSSTWNSISACNIFNFEIFIVLRNSIVIFFFLVKLKRLTQRNIFSLPFNKCQINSISKKKKVRLMYSDPFTDLLREKDLWCLSVNVQS